MSQPCAAPKCDRVWRVLCDCCKQNLCLQHLMEHNASLVSQLNPLTDEINALADRLNRLNIQQRLDDCRDKLEEWRFNCHQKIDHLFQKKCQELDLLVARKINEQREKTHHTQTKLAKLIRDQEASRQDVDTLILTIRSLATEMNKIDHARFSVNTCPLLVDDNIIQLEEIRQNEFDTSTLSFTYRTIVYAEGSSLSITSNNKLLLTHQVPNLCLLGTDLTVVKQVEWPHGTIDDMCWSSILDQFILIVKDNIFLVDEKTMSIDSVQTVKKQNWSSCTCSNNQLFLSTNAWGSSIMEVILSPSITIIKEWESPVTCSLDEWIDGMGSNNRTLALVIRNKVEKSMRMELRCCKTLARLWSLALNIVHSKDLVFRCCLLNHNGWFVADHTTGRLMHISTDGKMTQTVTYKQKPFRVTMFGSNILAISTKTNLNFHKI